MKHLISRWADVFAKAALLLVAIGSLSLASPALAAECTCGDGSSNTATSCSACVSMCAAAGRGGMQGYNGTSGNTCSGETAVVGTSSEAPTPTTPSPTSASVAPPFHTAAEYGYVNPLGTTNIRTIINRIVRTALGFVGALFLVMFIYGGILWMTAAGEEKKVQRGKDAIKNAVIGMCIVALSYSIISIIFQAAGLVQGTGTFATPTAPPGAPAQSCTVSSDCTDPLAVCEGGVCVNVTR